MIRSSVCTSCREYTLEGCLERGSLLLDETRVGIRGYPGAMGAAREESADVLPGDEGGFMDCSEGEIDPNRTDEEIRGPHGQRGGYELSVCEFFPTD